MLRVKVDAGELEMDEAAAMIGGSLTPARMRPWPSPRASRCAMEDLGNVAARGNVRGRLEEAVAMWATPCASDADRGGTITLGMSGKSLAQQVKTPARWPTPCASDATQWNNLSADERLAKGHFVRLFNAVGNPVDFKGKMVNPDWEEWLMGWPIGWTAMEPCAGFGEWLAAFSADNGAGWFAVDPSIDGRLPLVTERHSAKRARVRAIGNGQVPATLVLAVMMLTPVAAPLVPA